MTCSPARRRRDAGGQVFASSVESGSSASVNVTPAPLGSFSIVTASGQSVAGKEIALTIRALDRYGDPVTDYASRYKGVRLYSKDAGTAPDLIPPSSFIDGVARVGIVMKSAGDHTVKVSELQSNTSGEFSVRIVPAGVKTLSVSTPDSAVAGEPFQITITSEDEYGNRTQAFPPGSVVRLSSSGTGTVNPQTVAPSAFKEGVAKLKVSYAKAESFELTASLADSGKAAPMPSPADEKEKARASALKAREEAMRARRESRLRQKRVSETVTKSTEPGIRKPHRLYPIAQLDGCQLVGNVEDSLSPVGDQRRRPIAGGIGKAWFEGEQRRHRGQRRRIKTGQQA